MNAPAPFADWVGRQKTQSDVLSARQVHSLRAVLGHHDLQPVPPLAHWMLAPDIACEQELGEDGHPQRGRFLPAITLPRRMWAAGSVDFLRPLPVGELLSRQVRIEAITRKQGRSGELLFLDLAHSWHGAQGQALIKETQRIVYREAPGAVPPAALSDKAPLSWPWQRSLQPGPTLLMRYSALTFNSHRIHYDQPYARETEGYPDLVVQGPLLATLLADLATRHLADARLTHFSFRALSPAFVSRPLQLCGRREGETLHLCALGAQGELLMQAEARCTTP